MIELALHRELYSREAVDAAVEAFAGHASVEVDERGEAYVLRCTPTTEVDERQLADELGNFALGLTIEARGPRHG